MLGSRATLAGISLFSAGSIAWYTHLYGTLPFLGEVHASSPGEEGLHPPAYPWSHKGLLETFDHARSVNYTRRVLINFMTMALNVAFAVVIKSTVKSAQLATL